LPLLKNDITNVFYPW